MKNKGKKTEEERIAVFLDFSEFDRLESIGALMDQLRNLGRIVIGKVYINQDGIDQAREMLSNIAKLGLEPIVTVFSKEVRASLDIMEYGYNPELSSLLVGWSDDSIHPALLGLREQKKIWVASTKSEKLKGLDKIADRMFIIGR